MRNRRHRCIGIWTDRKDGLIGIYDAGSDSNGWPSISYDENIDDWTDFWLPEIVAPHLQDEEVAIFLEPHLRYRLSRKNRAGVRPGPLRALAGKGRRRRVHHRP